MSANENFISFLESPLGWLEITTSQTSLLQIDFLKQKPKQKESKSLPDIMKKTKTQLKEFFSGKRKKFDLKLDMYGTDFQKKVWKALQKVPYGKTLSYKEIAEKVGNSKAARAVGLANNKNPIPLVVPCHRIVGSNGKMVGYASGVNKKVWLIDLEKQNNA